MRRDMGTELFSTMPTGYEFEYIYISHLWNNTFFREVEECQTEAHSDLEQDLNEKLQAHGRRCIISDPIIEMVSKQVNFENIKRCERMQTLAGIRIYFINRNVAVCQKSSEELNNTKSDKYRFIAVPTQKQGKSNSYLIIMYIAYLTFLTLTFFYIFVNLTLPYTLISLFHNILTNSLCLSASCVKITFGHS